VVSFQDLLQTRGRQWTPELAIATDFAPLMTLLIVPDADPRILLQPIDAYSKSILQRT
jgi:hypothetical protein